MEAITLKMDGTMLKAIDSSLGHNFYSTRTEFIRDAIRLKLEEIEKRQRIEGLKLMQGIIKHKVKKMSKRELDELAKKHCHDVEKDKNILKNLGIK